jgi:hypothetical protein
MRIKGESSLGLFVADRTAGVGDTCSISAKSSRRSKDCFACRAGGEL